MVKPIFSPIKSFVLFSRNVIGCIQAPYATYRKLSSEKTDLRQTVFIPLLVVLYFIYVATLRTGLANPFLLTVKFNILIFASLSGFALMISLFYLGGKLTKGNGTLRQIYTLWVFSLIPTLTWFFASSILYILLPPPRTMSFLGKLYSVVFITFSLSVLLWKIILYYLTLRFSLKLDLWRILQISALVIPVVSVYTLLMYRWGAFRVPFI